MNSNSLSLHRAGVGIAVGIAWIAGLFAVTPLVGGFALEAVAQSIIFYSPGWLSTAAISTFGFYAQPLLMGAVTLAVLVVTALLAASWPSQPTPFSTMAVIVGTVVTAAVVLMTAEGLSAPLAVAIVVAVIPPSLVARLLTPQPDSQSRRRFLTRVGAIGAAGTVSVLGLRTLFDRVGPTTASERAGEPLERSISPPEPEGDPAFDFDGMPDAVTSPADHYVVDIAISNPRIEPETWTLDIDGAVSAPYTLEYDELLEHEASRGQTTTMCCISNQVGGSLIGTAHWTGVQLSDLIEAAEPTDSAVDVVTHAADGYTEAIPLELIEREDILIAYGMGDRTLETDHGFPARLLVPGRYGMKMTKWITRIELVEREHEAYWEARGWDEEAIVNTMAYVRGATREDDTVTVGGVAFGGLETGVEEISGVEVSVDGGETWADGELESQIAPHAWRRWHYEFEVSDPDREAFDVVVRAIERDGTVQTSEESSPRPSGATGWHRETVRP